MSDDEIIEYVESKISELVASATDIASLSTATPEDGDTFLFVKDSQLVLASFAELGSSVEALTTEEITAAAEAAS